jgi:hypothetical protein
MENLDRQLDKKLVKKQAAFIEDSTTKVVEKSPLKSVF